MTTETGFEKLIEAIEDFSCCSGECCGHPEIRAALEIAQEMEECHAALVVLVLAVDADRNDEHSAQLKKVAMDRARVAVNALGKAHQPQRITFCGQQVDVACDRRCDKAWGRDSRPRKQLSDNPDDYVFVSDNDFGRAPFPSDSTEGDQGKPSGTSHQGPLNKWCVRQCERSVMVDAGRPIALRDFEHPLPNILRR